MIGAAGAQARREIGPGVPLAALSAATFATSGTFATALIGAGWSPLAAVTARVVLAALVLTVPALLQLRGQWGLLRRGLGTVVLYGAVAVAGCQLCYFEAVQQLSVGVALLLEYSGTLLVVLWVWLRRGRRPRALTVIGGLIALAGLGLVLDLAGHSPVALAGVLWGLGAAVGLAVYFVVSSGGGGATARDSAADAARGAAGASPAADQAPTPGLPPLVAAWGGLAVGALALLVACAARLLPVRAPRADVLLLDARVSWLVAVVGLALVSTVVAYVAGIAAARRLGATLSSFVGLTEVLFAIGVAWVALGQRPSPMQGLGGALVLAGVVLVRLDEMPARSAAAGRRRRRRRPPHDRTTRRLSRRPHADRRSATCATSLPG